METTKDSSQPTAASSPPMVPSPEEAFSYDGLARLAKEVAARRNRALDPEQHRSGDECGIRGCQFTHHYKDADGNVLPHTGSGWSSGWLVAALLLTGFAAWSGFTGFISHPWLAFGVLVALLFFAGICFMCAVPDDPAADQRRNIEYHRRGNADSLNPVKEHEVFLELLTKEISGQEDLARQSDPFESYLAALTKGKDATKTWLEQAKQTPEKDRLKAFTQAIERTAKSHAEYVAQEEAVLKRQGEFFACFAARREEVDSLRSPLEQLHQLERLRDIERDAQDVIDSAREACEARVVDLHCRLEAFTKERLEIGNIVAAAITSGRSDLDALQAIEECIDRARDARPAPPHKQPPKSARGIFDGALASQKGA
jgi:hypothetical protein